MADAPTPRAVNTTSCAILSRIVPNLTKHWVVLSAVVYGWLVLGVLPRYIANHPLTVQQYFWLTNHQPRLSLPSLEPLSKILFHRHPRYDAHGHLCTEQDGVLC